MKVVPTVALPEGSTLNTVVPEEFSTMSGLAVCDGHAWAIICDPVAGMATAGVVSM